MHKLTICILDCNMQINHLKNLHMKALTHHFELSNKTGRTCEDILPLFKSCIESLAKLKDHKSEIVSKKPFAGTWMKEIPVIELSCATDQDHVIEGEIFAYHNYVAVSLAIPEMAARVIHGKELADALKARLAESN